MNIVFVPLIIGMVSWIIISLATMEQKKQKKAYEELMDKLERDSTLLSERVKLAGFTLKKADLLHTQIHREQQSIKKTNRFLNQAIKEKVNKKKIRGKRRRKTA